MEPHGWLDNPNTGPRWQDPIRALKAVDNANIGVIIKQIVFFCYCLTIPPKRSRWRLWTCPGRAIEQMRITLATDFETLLRTLQAVCTGIWLICVLQKWKWYQACVCSLLAATESLVGCEYWHTTEFLDLVRSSASESVLIQIDSISSHMLSH